MRKEILALLGIVIVLVLMGSCKSAQENQKGSRRGKQERPSVEELFEKMDENEDGKLSEKEVRGPLSDNFDEIDTDEDGFLSKEEIDNAPKPSGKQNGMRGGGRPQ